MKFVCDNCKAKYQIGDDKVAGKTVRMKCRKCGYNIKVSPGGLEVADAPSIDAPSHDFEAPVSMASPVAQAFHDGAAALEPRPKPRPPSEASHAAPAPARSTWGDDESTSIMNAPVRDAVAAVTGLVDDAGSAPKPLRAPSAAAPLRPAPAPRPVTTAPHPPRPVTAGGTPRPFASPAPRPVGAVGVGPRPHEPAPAPRPVSRQSSASLAAVQHDHAPLQPLHAAPQAAPAHAPPPPEVEWYVGIRGTPIGPVRVSVIRERAAANEVDGESLVWREGLPEWRPLRTIPELFEVVTAAQRPPPTPTPTPFVAVVAPAPLAAAPAPLAPAPPAAAPAAPLQVMGDPFAPAPSPVGSTNGAQNGKANGFHVAADAAALAPGISAPAPVAPTAAASPSPSRHSVDIDPAVEEALIPRRRGGMHPMAYAFIAAVAVFSGVAAYVLIPRPPPQIIVLTATPSSVPTPVAPLADKGEAQIEVGDPAIASSSPVARLGGPRPKASATASAAAVSSPIDTSGFINNVPGPAATAAGGPSPGGGQLSQGEMSGVVASNQPRVRRKCWQPALDGQAANGPKNARVTVQISIGASGNVESASASGAERDFPGLASCIGGMVKGWKFPPSGGSTQVNVPFMFAGQ